MARNSDSVKRAKRSFDFLFIKNKSAPIRQENELTLHLSKTELFDRVILLPHAELNAAVYHAVNQFTAKYTGSRMKLTIFCDPVCESLQNTFREVYAAHYRDEYRKESSAPWKRRSSSSTLRKRNAKQRHKAAARGILRIGGARKGSARFGRSSCYFQRMRRAGAFDLPLISGSYF